MDTCGARRISRARLPTTHIQLCKVYVRQIVLKSRGLSYRLSYKYKKISLHSCLLQSKLIQWLLLLRLISWFLSSIIVVFLTRAYVGPIWIMLSQLLGMVTTAAKTTILSETHGDQTGVIKDTSKLPPQILELAFVVFSSFPFIQKLQINTILIWILFYNTSLGPLYCWFLS